MISRRRPSQWARIVFHRVIKVTLRHNFAVGYPADLAQWARWLRDLNHRIVNRFVLNTNADKTKSVEFHRKYVILFLYFTVNSELSKSP